MILHVCLCQTVKPFLHTVGEDRYHAEHFRTRLAQHVHHLDATACCGNQVFYHYHFLPFLQSSLNLVLASVVFRPRAHIAHRQIEFGGSDSRMRNTRRRGTHQHLCIRVVRAYRLCQSVLHILAHRAIRKGQTVIAIDGALDTACPRKRLFGTQEHRPYLQQVFGYLFTQFHI